MCHLQAARVHTQHYCPLVTEIHLVAFRWLEDNVRRRPSNWHILKAINNHQMLLNKLNTNTQLP